MTHEERSKYIRVYDVTLDGKPARIQGISGDLLATIITINRDYEGRLYYHQCPWEEANKIVEEQGGRFYGGEEVPTYDDSEKTVDLSGFIYGVIIVVFILALIGIVSR